VEPVHGARHDAYAYEASGLKSPLENVRNNAADLGYTGVDGIDIVPYGRPPGRHLNDWQGEFNTHLSKIRAAVEHANARVKASRMLSEEGGRFRCHRVGEGAIRRILAAAACDRRRRRRRGPAVSS
jgi:hypothetical protein